MDVREPESWDELFEVAARHRPICDKFQAHLRQFETLSDALRALPSAMDGYMLPDAEDAYGWFWEEGDGFEVGPDYDEALTEEDIAFCVERAREFWFEAISS